MYDTIEIIRRNTTPTMLLNRTQTGYVCYHHQSFFLNSIMVDVTAAKGGPTDNTESLM